MNSAKNIPGSWRNVVLILIAIWVGIQIYNGMLQVSGILTVRGFRPDFPGYLVFSTLKIWMPWVVLSPAVVFLARRYPLRPDNWIRMALLHLGFLLALSLIAGTALSLHYHFREEMNEAMKGYQPWHHIGHFLFGDSFFLFHAIIYTVFITSFNIRNFHDMAARQQLDSERLAHQLKDARLQALKMQINPHFLFNTLNGIDVLIKKGRRDEAREMLQKLSRFFRASLEEPAADMVPLATELETISQYLSIEQIRFGDRMRRSDQHDPQASAALVPCMILQPLVENAMRHGVAESEGVSTISLRSSIVGTRLRLTVEDDGPGCDFDQCSNGVGLTNVFERLRQMYGDDFELTLDGRPGNGVKATLDIPLRYP